MRRTLTLVCYAMCLAGANALNLNAAEKLYFQGVEEFRNVVFTNETLAQSGVDIVTLTNGKTYLLAIGTTVNQAQMDSGLRAKIDTRKVAESKARRAAAEFVKVEVHTTTKLLESKESLVNSTNNLARKHLKRLIKVREEMTVQKSEAIFSGSRTVATWFEDGNTSFSAVLAIEFSTQAH